MRFLSDPPERQYVLGVDLGDEVSQISFLAPDMDMPQTLSVLAGAELYNIPTVLYKRRGVGQWFYGKEALQRAEAGSGEKIDRLLEKARSGERVHLDDGDYDPVALLTLFVKRSLSLLSMELSLDRVAAVVFTTQNLDRRMVEVLGQVTGSLSLKNAQVYYQSYEESLYYYMLYQPQELKFYHVLACDYRYGDLTIYDLVNNYRTTPIVTTVDKTVSNAMALPGSALPADALALHKAKGQLDDAFLKILRRQKAEKQISSVFLLGDGFKGDWAHDSLTYLCEDARVFQGNNLFSKGASIAARERVKVSEAGEKHILLGADKLKSNLGIRLKKQGSECYQALMDAGVNWYEVGATLDVILNGDNEIRIEQTPLTGGEPFVNTIVLDGLAKRPAGTTRLRISVDMTDEATIRARVKDLGFGDIFRATGMEWTATFQA